FPQALAQVLCDTPLLRLSAWNDAAYLYVQAVLWTDDDDTLGTTRKGSPTGDWGAVVLDVEPAGPATPFKGRYYHVNPWPSLPGLRLETQTGPRTTGGLQNTSGGRGAVRYLPYHGRLVRVDSFLIPLQEIGRRPGDALPLAYHANSPHPRLDINSIAFQH